MGKTTEFIEFLREVLSEISPRDRPLANRMHDEISKNPVVHD
jgi:hypothetical protein